MTTVQAEACLRTRGRIYRLKSKGDFSLQTFLQLGQTQVSLTSIFPSLHTGPDAREPFFPSCVDDLQQCHCRTRSGRARR